MKNLIDKRNLLGVALFISCTAISVLAWLIILGMAFSSGLSSTLGNNNKSDSGSNLTFLFLLILPVVLFAGSALLFHRALGTNRSVLLGVSVLSLPVVFVVVFQSLVYWDNYHPKNGTQTVIVERLTYSGNEGDVKSFRSYSNGQIVRTITICPNGLYRYIGEFENNRRKGTHLESPGCMPGSDTTLTTYGAEGEAIDTIKLTDWYSVGGPYVSIYHSVVENADGGARQHSLSFRWRPETNTYYRSAESISYPKGHTPGLVYREFNADGKLVAEHSDR